MRNGADAEARANLSLGSLYGGLCLGPVNTAAVHALAYPLGSWFKIAHGVSNAVLLPNVLRFNFSAAPERYAEVAVALGVERNRPRWARPNTVSSVLRAVPGVRRAATIVGFQHPAGRDSGHGPGGHAGHAAAEE